MRARLLPLAAVVLSLVCVAPVAHAQLGDRIRDRVRRDAERRIEERAVALARRTLDVAEDAIVCAVTDDACIAGAQAQGQTPVVVDAQGQPVSGYPPSGGTAGGGSDSGSGSASGAGSGSASGGSAGGGEVWANYDFVPGERVLFAHDFEGAQVGNFPSRLTYIAGNLDVVRLGTGDAANQVLRVGDTPNVSGNGCFTINLPETLPQQFTLEFRAMTTDPGLRDNIKIFSDGSDDTPDARCNYPPPTHLIASTQQTGLLWPGVDQTQRSGYTTDEWASYALGCDGDYCKVFVNGVRKANVPRWEFPRAAALHVFMNVYRNSLYIDDIRIAEGGARSLYDDLDANGEIATTAIRFDTGSATIKPESGGILAEIVAMLREHPDLRVDIEGHTDSDGTDAANQTLSERRAAAVKARLVAQGIDGGRLTTSGRGESAPVASNDTPEGKAMNRRVRLVRL
jgi:outer membrane protein OmpA-like peptidoglycan-associated protein